MMLKLVIISILFCITSKNIFINCIEQKNLADNSDKEPVQSPSDTINVHISPEVKDDQPHKEVKIETKVHTETKVKGDVPQVDVNKETKKGSSSNSTISFTPIPIRAKPKDDILQSGALLRGFYVFLGLSVITTFYFVYRSYRLRHGSQPSSTVKKYGVTARRSDMEMRPLELDDEDDDTLFEVNTHTAIR